MFKSANIVGLLKVASSDREMPMFMGPGSMTPTYYGSNAKVRKDTQAAQNSVATTATNLVGNARDAVFSRVVAHPTQVKEMYQAGVDRRMEEAAKALQAYRTSMAEKGTPVPDSEMQRMWSRAEKIAQGQEAGVMSAEVTNDILSAIGGFKVVTSPGKAAVSSVGNATEQAARHAGNAAGRTVPLNAVAPRAPRRIVDVPLNAVAPRAPQRIVDVPLNVKAPATGKPNAFGGQRIGGAGTHPGTSSTYGSSATSGRSTVQSALPGTRRLVYAYGLGDLARDLTSNYILDADQANSPDATRL